MPTKLIYEVKKLRSEMRILSIRSGADPDIQPFTEEQHYVNQAWVGLYQLRFALQMLEDLMDDERLF